VQRPEGRGWIGFVPCLGMSTKALRAEGKQIGLDAISTLRARSTFCRHRHSCLVFEGTEWHVTPFSLGADTQRVGPRPKAYSARQEDRAGLSSPRSGEKKGVARPLPKSCLR